MKLGHRSRMLGRLAGALLAAAGLAAGLAGETKPAAAYDIASADLLDVRIAADESLTASVTFRDNSSSEMEYRIEIAYQKPYQRIGYVSFPAVPGEGQVVTRSFPDRLLPETDYCFSVRVLKFSLGRERSDATGELCRTTPPVGLKPDLVTVRVSGDTTLRAGESSVYEVAVRNDGAAVNGSVNLEISFTGTLKGVSIVETPAGFACVGTTTFTCNGSLGGVSDAVQSRVAVVRVRVRAEANGAGQVSLAVNPTGALQESDLSNNTKALAVTVQ